MKLSCHSFCVTFTPGWFWHFKLKHLVSLDYAEEEEEQSISNRIVSSGGNVSVPAARLAAGEKQHSQKQYQLKNMLQL
jgi:hypothetical protein